MRAIVLTTADGQKPRFNPFGIIGWRLGEVPLPDGKVVLGTAIILPGGPVGVLESVTTVDQMFREATAPADRFTSHVIERPDATVESPTPPMAPSSVRPRRPRST